MITSASEEKLIILSDLHLGNPFCHAKREIVEFLSYAVQQGYSICINGDGLDIAQTSFIQLTREIPEVFSQLRRAKRNGGNVYYCIGNHDILLEHLLDDWGLFTLVPFLNVESHGKRFHIQHGHNYDPFYMSRPALYEFLTHLAGYALKLWPGLYRAWIAIERMTNRASQAKDGIPGEPPAFTKAARDICRRGFDGVIFGHTHHPGLVPLEDGGVYVNTGSWLLRPHFAEINEGELSLRRWPLDLAKNGG
jgi:UDP-2,3-diacylglucosamine pyrophosphatase LpxH